MSAAKPPFDSIRDLIASMPAASEASRQAAHTRQAELTKPPGSLGRLEEIVAFLAAWQGKREPSIDRLIDEFLDQFNLSRARRPITTF